MVKRKIIFCDFDGTITEKDNIVQILKQFGPPGWEEIKDQVLGQQVSIQEGVGKMFSLIPSKLKCEIIEFVLTNATIRPGFGEFLAYVKQQDIPFYIVSGGIDFFVNPLLASLGITDAIYCNESDFSGQNIKILWPHTCDENCSNQCGCCKPSIIRNFPKDEFERIIIGDSITDLAAARIADKVYARSFLLEKCQEEDLPYVPFGTFHDILEQFKNQEVKV